MLSDNRSQEEGCERGSLQSKKEDIQEIRPGYLFL